jgi:surface polysaccharide O-acyltransferase-like enzyme
MPEPSDGPFLQVPVNKPAWMHYGDMIRILGTIAVVIGHVCDVGLDQHPLSLNWWICQTIDGATRWAVPAYIMLSGALLLDPARADSPSHFYRKRLNRIGVPLVFWSAFFMIFSVRYTGWATWRQAWINLAIGQPYIHMHFIFRIAGLYAFTPMLRVFLRHATRSMQIATCILLLGLASADSIANSFTSTELSAFARFAPFLGYYLAGYLLRHAFLSTPALALACLSWLTSAFILIAGTGLLVHQFGMKWNPSPGMLLYDLLNPVRIAMSISAWLILITLFQNPWPRAQWAQHLTHKWAGLTLGIYLIHPAFRDMWFLGRFGPRHFPWTITFSHGFTATWPNVYLGIPLTVTLVYIPSLIATAIIMRVPYLRRIDG